MPHGKPAGVPCVQLDTHGRCRIFGQPQRPAVCVSLQASADMCGDNRLHAMRWLARLEAVTAPARGSGMLDDSTAGAQKAGLDGRN